MTSILTLIIALPVGFTLGFLSKPAESNSLKENQNV